MKLLFATTVASTLTAFLLPYARHFRSKGWQVDGMAADAAHSEECEASFDKVFDAHWARTPLSPGNIKAAREVRNLVEREGYDIVHVHTPVAAFVTRMALGVPRRARRTRVVYTAHGFHFYSGAPFLRNVAFVALEKMARRSTDALVVINAEDYRQALHHRLAAPGGVVAMPGIGVPIEDYLPESVDECRLQEMRRRLGPAGGRPVFTMIAEFVPNKRHEDAVQALAALEHRNAALALAGEGPLQATVHSLVRDKGLSDRVAFLGTCRDIPALLAQSVATVLPSSREGLPRSIMESLCAGVPALVSDIRGNRDLVSDGFGGRTFRVGDWQTLAHRMSEVLRHPAEARALGKAGQSRMREYDLQRVLRLHEELYERLRAGGGPPLVQEARPFAAREGDEGSLHSVIGAASGPEGRGRQWP